jgi:hypothetical protein
MEKADLKNAIRRVGRKAGVPAVAVLAIAGCGSESKAHSAAQKSKTPITQLANKSSESSAKQSVTLKRATTFHILTVIIYPSQVLSLSSVSTVKTQSLLTRILRLR